MQAQRETAPKPFGRERFFIAQYMASPVMDGLCRRRSRLPVTCSRSANLYNPVHPVLQRDGGFNPRNKELDHD